MWDFQEVGYSLSDRKVEKYLNYEIREKFYKIEEY